MSSESERGEGRRDQPPEASLPGSNAPYYGAEYAEIWAAHGIPFSQAEPPAGAMGDIFAIRPACEQLTWLYFTTPAPVWQAVTVTPDHGKLVWHQWIIPFGNPGTRLDAQKAMSSGGICKLEGATVPLLTHADVQQAHASLNNGTMAQMTTDWAGLGLLVLGGILVTLAALSHHVKAKDVATEDSAQFEAFNRAFTGGQNDHQGN